MAGLSSLRGGVVCGRFFSLSRVFPGLLGGGARRGYVDDLTDKLGKREAAEERMYFNKEDEKLLRGLLGKMKVRARAKLGCLVSLTEPDTLSFFVSCSRPNARSRPRPRPRTDPTKRRRGAR
mmetsp:Transcript_30302/g.64831  ORF Transcript_30302/g.64831 Transcript_30302/m.64831 type:complete len:122 (-) Transcript_30302:204-569(-)